MTAAKRRRPNPDTPAARLLAIREALVPDPFGHRQKLAAAWEVRAARESADLGRLGFDLAEAIGACFVTRTGTNEHPTRLPAEIALAALGEVSARLAEWTGELDRDRVSGEAEASTWMHRRHAIWLAMEGVRQSALDGPVFAALHGVMDELDAFDRALSKRKPKWAAWLESETAQEWRESLQGPYRAARPWWLDPNLFNR